MIFFLLRAGIKNNKKSSEIKKKNMEGVATTAPSPSVLPTLTRQSSFQRGTRDAGPAPSPAAEPYARPCTLSTLELANSIAEHPDTTKETALAIMRLFYEMNDLLQSECAARDRVISDQQHELDRLRKDDRPAPPPPPPPALQPQLPSAPPSEDGEPSECDASAPLYQQALQHVPVAPAPPVRRSTLLRFRQ